MAQTYFEAPHSDTHVLWQDNISDTQKHISTELRPFSTNARGANKAVLHQQSLYPYSSPQTPANMDYYSSHGLAHVSRAQIPSGPACHAHEAKNFAENPNFHLVPGLYHAGLQRVVHRIQIPRFERSGTSAGYQSLSESRRPDTVIHVYHHPPALLSADANLERKSHALPRR